MFGNIKAAYLLHVFNDFSTFISQAYKREKKKHNEQSVVTYI